MAPVAGFQRHLGWFGCLNFAPSILSNSKLLHHHHHYHHRQQEQPNYPLSPHFNTIRLSAANSDTTATEQKQIQNWDPSSSSTSIKGWAEFAEKVSGEWDGYGADFSKEGEPIELPESVVPEAFREWEVKVYDWQTQCPTLAHPNHLHHFFYKLIRLLPTVGCEADAATTYSILQRNLNTVDAFFAYQSSSGCYVGVWAEENSSRRVLELEHCLVDPRDKESRVRIIQEVRVQQQQPQGKRKTMQLQLEKIKVFCEQWYGPFRNGDQLGGCAIRDSAFASTPPLQSSLISGVWDCTSHSSATFHHSSHSPRQVSRQSEGGSVINFFFYCVTLERMNK